MSRIKRVLTATLPYGDYEAKIVGFDEYNNPNGTLVSVIKLEIPDHGTHNFEAYSDAQWDTQVKHILAQIGKPTGTVEDALNQVVKVKYHPYKGEGYDTPLRSWSFDVENSTTTPSTSSALITPESDIESSDEPF